MMLKLIVVFLLLSFNLQAKKFKVVTTFTIIADIASNVAGNAAEVSSITKAGAEVHNYKPTPRDIVKARNANLILFNGMNLELWFKKFLHNTGKTPSVVVTEGIEPLSIYGGAYDGKPNPHAWMSIANALIYVENIKKAFIKYDSDNANIYMQNAKTYVNKLLMMQKKLKKRLSFIPKDKRYLATSEGAFSYMVQDFDMQEVYLWSMNADQQGTTQQVRKMIDKVRKYKIPVVFSESTISNKPVRQVASETDAIYGGVLYVDSLSKKNGKVPTYLDLLSVTTMTIAEGFEKALK